MKIQLYELSFQEANVFLNFKFDNQIDLEKTEKNYYKVQKILTNRNWLELVGNRFSWLIIRDLIEIYPLLLSSISITAVIDEIERLEGVDESRSLTGKSKDFVGGHLGGLKKKNYYVDNMKILSKALLDELNNKKANQQFSKEMADFKSRQGKEVSIIQGLSLILNKVFNNFIDRMQPEFGVYTKHLTGEWIIFHEDNNGKKTYLALGEHEQDDSVKAAQINSFCKIEFPEIKIPSMP